MDWGFWIPRLTWAAAGAFIGGMILLVIVSCVVADRIRELEAARDAAYEEIARLRARL